jgi:catechol 2,3-dioxygenase-like lactoylglutathione lyase family enzyme
MSARNLLVFCCAVLVAGCAAPPPAERPAAPARPAVAAPGVPPLIANPRAYAYAVVSVADMDQAIGLWVERLGLEIVARREGSDPGLARAWGLEPRDIIDQALLRTPGMVHGGLHLVRFRVPGPPVREGASPTDLVPKSIDIAVRDIDARYAELEAAGFRFRSPVGTLDAGGLVFREMHTTGPDAVNLVFLEKPSAPDAVGPRGYGVAPQLVATSPDNLREKAFFERVLGLEETSWNRMGGAELERTVGLPRGAGLDIRIFGDRGEGYGRIEIVQDEGATGRDLYPRARPPARGLLSVTYFVPDVGAVLARAAAPGAPVGAAPLDHGTVRTIFGESRMATLTSPAGLRIDLVERR